MLGMAVDANVLIYERLREEREHGASLALAVRNGYDRAFPTIIDTHLTSIFTAIVLYVVGNDQLKGFGISLTVGLIISLFTSLVLTRTMFDFWMGKNWIHKLTFMQLFKRPNINFMRIRYSDVRPDRGLDRRRRHPVHLPLGQRRPEHRLRRRHRLRRPARPSGRADRAAHRSSRV